MGKDMGIYESKNFAGEEKEPRKLKWILTLLSLTFLVGMITVGCAKKAEEVVPEPAPQEQEQPEQQAEINVPTDDDTGLGSQMISYDVVSIGRADPFMPSGEIAAFEEARQSALAEASAYNSKIAKLEKLKKTVIREPDDISPYSFNLPVPPTSLAPADSAAAKITRTKVVGIMYNKTSPSAIINVDDKDYLVRQGDKIIGQEYKVMEINPSWITVSLGSNVYSASIGELFSRDDLDKSQNDLYNLRNRFGGRKG
jgi:hypothetical protein